MLRSILMLAATLTVACPVARAAPPACAGYAYAGFQSPVVAYGVSAQLTVLAEPSLERGHVGAWIGVGGEGLGAGGADAWLQAGVAAFPGGGHELFYEYRLPGQPRAVYVPLGSIAPGEPHQVAVVERTRRPGSWRVLVDGVLRSPGIRLPGSHGAWKPIATAETWDGGEPVCNRFAYDFSTLALATRAAGGGWRAFPLVNPFAAAGYRVLARESGFTAFAP